MYLHYSQPLWLQRPQAGRRDRDPLALIGDDLGQPKIRENKHTRQIRTSGAPSLLFPSQVLIMNSLNDTCTCIYVTYILFTINQRTITLIFNVTAVIFMISILDLALKTLTLITNACNKPSFYSNEIKQINSVNYTLFICLI